MGFGRACLDEWPLDPAITYLNHGTVGVTPLRVLRAQQRMRDEVERAPAQRLLRSQSGLVGERHRAQTTEIRAAAAVLAAFVGARAEDLVFIDNVTTGISAVLRSLTIAAGDEIVLTDHAYGAVTRAVHFLAGQGDAAVRTVHLPYPQFSRAATIEAIVSALSDRTRLVVLDHITAESALILPVAEVARVCRDRGIRVLVDGAHAPGVLPLDLPALGVDWYAANLHKWACAPRSCGFLWATPSAQADLHPPVISWGLDQGFAAEFDWVGTRDLSPWLAVPDALAYLTERNVEAAWRWNHGLAWEGASLLADAWGTVVPAGEPDIGFMATVPAPASLGTDATDAVRLRDALLFDHAIEVQVHAAYARVWVRISAQVYNERGDVERLAAAVLACARR